MSRIILGQGEALPGIAALKAEGGVNPNGAALEGCLNGHEPLQVFYLEGEDTPEQREAFATLTRLVRARSEEGNTGLAIYCVGSEAQDSYRLKERLIQWAAGSKSMGTLRFLAEHMLFRAALYEPLPIRERGLWVLEHGRAPAENPVESLASPDVFLVPDVTPWFLLRQRVRLGAAPLLGAAAFLCGLHTVKDCMLDGDLRRWFARVCTEEILPCVDGPREQMLAYTLRVCAWLEADETPLGTWNAWGLRKTRQYVLPSLADYGLRHQSLPRGVVFALAARAMLCAASQEDGNGVWYWVRQADRAEAREAPGDRERIRAFSCDMAPESLAYAFLADRDLWGVDLRQIPGLEETLAGLLGDMQRLGIRGALQSL